ncbi:LLM class flavin-dependent oxidoreductase [Frankia sp. Ag45/Mut15]|uniref:LLM class flavin-dependent oxidoreductase n=1 Tax=Frankia umida TaxID=573489 RepID=A0ABT0K2P9_9ACTN|nr:LLM class flavin-dependent oxidoreductase [Frankia umida]MCK9878035.1 LLM class flavin-dependent oxidoreductase [Frankia umida]
MLGSPARSVDHISRGRAGVNIVTSAPTGTALNFNRAEAEHPEHDERYRIAAEHLDVLRGLWDSWEQGALVRDRESGVFFDDARLHTLDHHGEHFAAREADGVFLGPKSHPAALACAQDIARRAAAFGRTGDAAPVLFTAITPFVGSTEQEARRIHREIADLVNVDEALRYLSLNFGGHDFTGYDLDAPFPELGETGQDAFQATSTRIKGEARRSGATLRQIALDAVTPRGEFLGTPEQIADRLAHWFETGATDGFMLLEAMPQGLRTFVDHVVPILRERGLVQREYPQGTLRASLGLPVPPNRFATIEEAGPSATAAQATPRGSSSSTTA